MANCRAQTALLIFLGLTVGAIPGRAEDLPCGRIIEKVVCRADPDQSYALYIPSDYTAGRKWPILYAFDAGARGLMPVQRFKDAAERYGYIVAGSNNSRNGPISIVETAVGALLDDTAARFSLNDKRFYLAGFSGGARVAVSIGFALKGKAAGVIGCGAGFPPSIKPSVSIPFAFYGTAGIEDFNFPEMRHLDQTLANLGTRHRLEVFQGGHNWPPEMVCTHAIEWMELQAMKSGTRQVNEDLIDTLFSEAVSDARSFEDSQQFYSAFQRYSAICADFAGLKDVTPFAAKSKQLASSREVKKAIVQEKNVEEQQRHNEETISGLVSRALTGDNRELAAQALLGTLADLRKQAYQTKNEGNRLAAARTLTSSWIQLNEATAADFERSDYRTAVVRLKLMAEIRPENFQVWIQLTRAYALFGNKKDALEALAGAVKRGFTDAGELERDRDFDSLRKETTFQKTLEELSVKKSPR